MENEELLQNLAKNKAWNTLLPSVNLIGIFIIVVVILLAKFGGQVTTIAGVSGVVFWTLQEQEVKNNLIKYWKELPQIFHLSFIFVELGIIAIVAALTFRPHDVSTKSVQIIFK